jgi:hypothetical protein
MATPVHDDIRSHGFRKWYERQLVRSHVHLVLLLLCTVAALGAVEAFPAAGGNRLLMALSLLVAAAIGAWALRRYLWLLMRAEALANQATCPDCQAYARWQVEGTGPAAADGDGEATLQACCRGCGSRWQIHL